VTAAAPWVAAEIEPEHAIAELRRRFPWALTWWGRSTGRWWAMFRDRAGRDRLVEASDPVEMGRLLEHLGGRIVPRFSRAAYQTGAAARRHRPRQGCPAPPCFPIPLSPRAGTADSRAVDGSGGWSQHEPACAVVEYGGPGHIWKELAWKRSGSPWVLGSSVSGMRGAWR
jgi:hypothetical protein